jgi:cytochrome c553
MASELDDATIEALAAWYAAQKTVPSARAGSAEANRGREIYEQGVAAQGVPACSSCHGPDAHGLQDFPTDHHRGHRTK